MCCACIKKGVCIMMKNGKKIAAFALSGTMLAASVIASGAYQSSYVYAEEAEEKGISLSIAGQDEETSKVEEVTEASETETETEAAAQEPQKEYETLETTHTGELAVNAIDVSEVVENAMPSVVSIVATSVQEVEDYFYGRHEIETSGAGSGIIIAQNDTELLIATNNHVAGDATNLTVCFTVDAEDPDELVVPAVVKGTSVSYDLAVVAVNLSDIPEDILSQLKIATLGSSKNLKVGETAIVIGNALGIGQTVTTGIISALECEVTTEAGTFTEFQTDAAINLGCSGGAILNSRGEVIGITSAKAVADYAESMGYGIPVDTAIPVLQELINRQTRSTVDNHGYLGITVVPVSEEAMQLYNMPAGAFVYEVGEGSGAEAAGIKKGDIITKFDGVEIDSSDTLVRTLGYYEAGETVTVELQVSEGGAYVTKEVEVTLQEGTEEQKEAARKEKEEKEKEEKEEKEEPDDSDQEDPGQYDPWSGDQDAPEYDGSNGYEDWYGGNDGFSYGPFGGFGDFFFGNGR